MEKVRLGLAVWRLSAHRLHPMLAVQRSSVAMAAPDPKQTAETRAAPELSGVAEYSV